MARWTLSLRLNLAFGLTALLLTALIGLGYVQQTRGEALLSTITSQDYQRMQQVSAWQLVATGTTVRIMALNRSNDPAIGKLFGAEIGPRIETINKHFAAIKGWATRPEEVNILREIDAATPKILAALGRIATARQTGDEAAAAEAFEQGFLPPVHQYHEAIDRFAALEQRLLAESVQTLQAQQHRLFWWGSATALLLVTIVGAVVVTVVRQIQRSLNESVHVAQAVARGDLSVHLPPPTNDEFGDLTRALDDMASGLRQVVQQVRDGTSHIVGTAQEIANGNQDLSTRTENQALNLQLTASTMDELVRGVRQSADSAVAADQLAQHAADVASRGGEAVGRVVDTMSEIEKSSRRIEEIIGVIDGISFQTNILALNAAVEAARAGEQGRGFAVVAGEVRTLAQRSASAAKEIKALISDSADKVRSGGQQVQAAGATMTELVQSVQQVSTLIRDISAATIDQRAGIDGVTQSVSELDQATQQNAALVQQSAIAASSMNDQAMELERAVAAFKVA